MILFFFSSIQQEIYEISKVLGSLCEGGVSIHFYYGLYFTIILL